MGRTPQIFKGFLRDLALFAFITFKKPFKKDFLVSHEGSLCILRDFKSIGELLTPLLEDVNQLIPRATSGNLEEVIQTICNLRAIVGDT
jgi:hypothetical protein